MKATELKKFIKDAVREAIQEELKEILLEAVKSPKQIVRESYSPLPPNVTAPPAPPNITMDARQAYRDVLGETALSFTSQDVAKFNPRGVDPMGGNLPGGELGMDQIMGLLNSK